MLPLVLAAVLAAPSLVPQRDPAPGPDPASPAAPQSVYVLSPVWDSLVIGATSLGSLVPLLAEDQLIQPRCPCDPREVNAFDRHVIGNHNRTADSISDATLYVSLLGPPVAEVALLGFHRAVVEDLAIEGESLAVSGALVTIAKYVVQRPLPVVYAGQAPNLIDGPGGYRSFFSGHTTLVFAALMAASTTYTLRRGPAVWPWFVTGVVGLSVAAERVAAGRHFYTDVMVGAIAGVGVGLLVPYLHERMDRGTLIVVPRAGGGTVAWAGVF